MGLANAGRTGFGGNASISSLCLWPIVCIAQRLDLREGSAPPTWAPVTLSSDSSDESAASSAEQQQRPTGGDEHDDYDRHWRKRRREERPHEPVAAADVPQVVCPSALELLPPPGLGAEFSRELAHEMREELELSQLRQSLIEQTLRSRILQVSSCSLRIHSINCIHLQIGKYSYIYKLLLVLVQ